jgi:histidinol-phosphate aminotransferase
MNLDYTSVRPEIRDFTPYSPGLSIEEIRGRYGLSRVIKLGSNENPLGTSLRVKAAIEKFAANVFHYPQSGEPRLSGAIARRHSISVEEVVPGNGSGEIIDLLIRVRWTKNNPCVRRRRCWRWSAYRADAPGNTRTSSPAA